MKLKTQIRAIIKRTHNVKSFRFERPPDLEYKPGQFMFVTITIDQEGMKKPFSISSSPSEHDYLEFTKKITGHKFSNALNSLKVGDWVNLDIPYGRFIFETKYNKIGMLSGGVGITPLRSMCKYSTDKSLRTKITLIYGNQTEKDIIFREAFTEMQQENPKLKVVYCLDKSNEDWSGYTGFINKDLIKKEIPDYTERVFYTCGPPAMAKAMEDLLKDLGLPREKMKKEIFAGY